MLLYNKMTVAELQNNFSLEVDGKVSRKVASFMCPFPGPFPEIIALYFIYWSELTSMHFNDFHCLTSYKVPGQGDFETAISVFK